MKGKVLLMGCLLAGPVFAEAVLTPAQVQAAYRSSEAQLLDRSGAPLQSLRVDMKVRRLPWVPLADISPAVQQAVLLAEDQRFMQHGGVDVSALATAAWDNLFPRKPGALDHHHAAGRPARCGLAGVLGRTQPAQKWDQMRAAQAIEDSWSKAQIFVVYLNLVSVRGELQGIASAS